MIAAEICCRFQAGADGQTVLPDLTPAVSFLALLGFTDPAGADYSQLMRRGPNMNNIEDMTRGRLIEVVTELRNTLRTCLVMIEEELRNGQAIPECQAPRTALARVGGILSRALGREGGNGTVA